MYISRITLRDVRCLRRIDIDLRAPPTGRCASLLFAGNNGIGKSATLRAIAMGLCDRDSAAALLRDLEGQFVRKSAAKSKQTGSRRQAVIDIELIDEERTRWRICTFITHFEDSDIDRVEQEYWREDKSVDFAEFSIFWSHLFVAGYGAGLRTTGDVSYSQYFAPDAIYSLIKYDVPLQSPELAWRRLIDASQRGKDSKDARSDASKKVAELLKYVLSLDASAKIELEPNGIHVSDDGESIPLEAMGDGHKALARMTLDILMWYLLKLNEGRQQNGDDWNPVPLGEDGKPDVRGIVIIDEVEQHLHPKLQREVLRRLGDRFPNVQFILTTHSPLCVSGTADLQDADGSYDVYSIHRQPGRGVTVDKRPIPVGLTADQILVDYFELPTTLSVSLEDDFKRMRTLFLKDTRTSKEEREFSRLKQRIKQRAPVLGESIEQREMMLEIRSAAEALQAASEKTERDQAN